MIRNRLHPIATALLAGLWPLLAAATETGGELPWNDPLERLMENITGPTATAIIFIALGIGFAMWSLSDDNRGLFRAGKAVISIAVVAAIVGGGLLPSLGIDAALL